MNMDAKRAASLAKEASGFGFDGDFGITLSTSDGSEDSDDSDS